MSTRTLAQKVIGPVLLVLTSLGFSLLLLELGLRAFGFDRMARVAEGRGQILRESEHPLRIFELTPHSRGTAWRTQVEINRYGFRDRELPVGRSDAARVVVIGDSITFGSGVTPEERFTDQLEPLLATRLAEPVEVLNLGVGGYDTLQEVATLEDVGLQFEPDLVLLAYCVNDVGHNSPNLEYIRGLKSAGSPLYRLRTMQLLRTTLDRLQLIRSLEADNQEAAFAERFEGLIERVNDDAALTALRDRLRTTLEGIEEPDFRLEWYLSSVHLGKVAHALTRLQALSTEHAFDVIVAIIPFLDARAPYEIPYAMVEHMTSSRGFETIDLRASLADVKLETLRSRESDPIHPNALGHRLIAEAIAPRVAARLRSR